MKTELPKSPDDMPMEWHNDDIAIRNCVVTLDSNRCVDIHWEQDDQQTQLSGEPEGQWTVEIRNSAGRFVGKHREITNALWFATTIADARWSDNYKQREEMRDKALAKLSAEDRVLLGLR